MSSLHFKANFIEGYQEIISENFDQLNYLALGKISLKKGGEFQGHTGGYETVLVILTGTASVSCKDKSWSGLGGRKTVFDGKGTAIYVPCQTEYKVVAESDVHIAVCKAKAEQKFEPFVVKPDDVIVNHRGKESWTREVHDLIPDSLENKVQRIILGETFNEAGKWSSYPPHKHDVENPPEEVYLEEIYYYQLDPEQGFGVQMHYTEDGEIDDAFIVRHGDSFAINKGYHPVVAAGGYKLYYLWFLAGKSNRVLNPKDEEKHLWLK
ncbi:5-deoxy-glucuronate isomerase [Tuberibacillus calidus]|jgi:5-deoxy-glucuronate isomerase|uniref:5-deoxy-glucuronate isomerase n=1 Tax=Tuberibacillus calidus TaxID=340097 RepID=UPI0003FC1799|nr:5-deoxy-glucuronate isomerase [Tuberibacillus calidus]